MSANHAINPLPRPVVTVSGSDQLFPVHRIYCVGRNYAAHAREMGHDGRETPFFFCKPADAVTHSDRVAYPTQTADLQHEVELVVALSGSGQNVPVEAALDLVFGYAVGVDLTRRDLQAAAKSKGRPWDIAKGFDQSAPISAIHPVAETGHPSSGAIYLQVDGKERQSGDLSDMIWNVAEIISELSRYFELRSGDLIFTGTPEGVGPVLPGQEISCGIEQVASHRFQLKA